MRSKKIKSVLAALMLSSTIVGGASASSTAAEESTEIFNSGFESGTDSWSGRGSAAVEVSKTNAKSGSSSLYVTGRTASWNGAVKTLASPFSAGQTYSFSANVMYTEGAAAENFKLSLQYTDASGTISYANVASAEVKKGEWAELSNDSYVLPTGASDFQLYIEVEENLIDFYIDDVIAKGSAASIPQKPVPATRGDLNRDGNIDVYDVILMREAIIDGQNEKSILKTADINGDGNIDKTDLEYVAGFVMGSVTEFPEIQYEEPVYEKNYNFPAVSSLASSADIPDPYKFMDGSVVEDPSQWGARANEISCMYEYYMYGVWRDGSDEKVSYSINGNKMKINIKRLSTGKTTSFDAVINLPSKVRHDGGAPVIVGMHTGISEKTAQDLGYAVITVDAGIFSNPVASDDTSHKGAFYDLYPYGNTWEEQTGVLMAWSWGCSKILDALYAGAGAELNINPYSSIVTGVSRWGKATSVCGAFDKRFKMCAPSCSGAGGLGTYRYKSEGKTYDFSSKGASSAYRYGQNEPLGSLQSTAERGWFNNRFLEFRNENQLPMDQHMLGSLVADEDRYLFIIGSCISEDWVNAPSMHLTFLGLQNIYDYLGISDNLAINIHKEGHAVIEEDIKYMVQYFDYHVYGIEPNMDLNTLKTSVFDLPKNRDPYFSTFDDKWTY